MEQCDVSIEIVSKYALSNADFVYGAVASAFEDLGWQSSQFDPEEQGAEIAEDDDHFCVDGAGGMEIHHSPIGKFQVSCTFIRANMMIDEAAELTQGLIVELSGHQAFLHDRDYEFWQNAADPLQYRAKGRPVPTDRLVDNGLPPPVNQMVVDTSHNPGRRTLRRGYVEQVSDPMWFSDAWIEQSLPALQCIPSVQLDSLAGYTKVSVTNRLFGLSSSDTQNELRRAIYSAQQADPADRASRGH